jgi:hypothetical protein
MEWFSAALAPGPAEPIRTAALLAATMTEQRRPTGHVYIAERKSGRSWYAKWRDADGQHQKRLGPAWVKPYGKTARDAPRWRTADGPKPAPSYLTPEEA